MNEIGLLSALFPNRTAPIKEGDMRKEMVRGHIPIAVHIPAQWVETPARGVNATTGDPGVGPHPLHSPGKKENKNINFNSTLKVLLFHVLTLVF